jgi:hypothetical protein
MAPPLTPLMTPDEVATTLRVTPRTLTYWRSIEEGPVHIRIGKHCRYPADEMAAFIANPTLYNRYRRHYDDLAGYIRGRRTRPRAS